MATESPLFGYLRTLRRWWFLVVAGLLFGAGGAAVTLPDSTANTGEVVEETPDPDVSYRATEILLRQAATSATANLDLVAVLAKTGEIPARAAEALADVDPLSVERVEVAVDPKLGTVTVSSVQPTEERALTVTRTYADVLVGYFDEKLVDDRQDRIERATERLKAMDQRISELESQAARLPEGSVDRRLAESELAVLIDQYGRLQVEVRDLHLDQIEESSTFVTMQDATAVPTAAQTSGAAVLAVPDDPLPRIAIGAVVGLLLGVAAAFGADHLDTRVRDEADAEDAYRLPVVAVAPHRRRRHLLAHPVPVATDPGSAAADAYRALRFALQLSPRWELHRGAPVDEGFVGRAVPVDARERPVRTVLVTSAAVGEGKSTTVANLAAAYAEMGDRVLVIDADLRRSAQHELLQAGAGTSVGQLATEPDRQPTLRTTAVKGVSLLSAGEGGRPLPPRLLARPTRLLELAAEQADVVIIDTAPLLANNDAAALVSEVDAVVVVGRPGRTSIRQARRLTDALTRLDATALGVAMIGATELENDYGAYYAASGVMASEGENP